MIVKQFVEGFIANNNYLLIDEDSKEAALIDCTDYISELGAVLKEYDAKLKYILLTHGHFDHIMGVPKIKQEFGAKVYLHKDDKELVDKSDEFMISVGMQPFEHPEIDKYIDENEEIYLGKNKIQVIHLPGHTQGGVGYLVDGMLFAGDSIFLESVGRTDLPGGNHKQLIESIKNKIFSLDGDTILYVGHGTNTTVEHEKNIMNLCRGKNER